jgi:casein kinase II subunit alpha
MIAASFVVRITGLLLLVVRLYGIVAASNSGPPYSPLHHDTTLPFEYETMPYPPPWVPIHSKDRYLLTRRLGTGKFSDVFEAIDLGPNWKDFDLENDDCATFDDYLQSKEYPRVVIKCLKPIAERKIRRELYLLHCCRHLPNIIRLKALILPHRDDTDVTSMPCLVMEHAGTEWLGPSHLDPPLTSYEIRYFTFQLLIAMRALHEAGIMHRDIKPRNVMIQRSGNSRGVRPRLTLIDLGLADLYQPGRTYNVRVASRHYKAPELLLGDTFYHGPAVDVWAFGCLLASLLSNREPFFRGRDLDDQLVAIQNILGTGEDWQQWIARHYGRRVAEALQGLEYRPRRPAPWLPGDMVGDDLVQHILQYDPAARYTTEQIMAHAFFDPVRERCQNEVLSLSQRQK